MAVAIEKKTFLGLTSGQAAGIMGGAAPAGKETQCVGALTGEEFAEIVGSGGGGGGGTTNYNALTNKPSIAGVELRGDKTLLDLGIASSTKVSQLETRVNEMGFTYNATEESLTWRT